MAPRGHARFIAFFSIFLIAGPVFAEGEELIETVEKLRAALDREDYETAKTFLTENPRVWYDGREGEGFPWTLDGGRWKGWDGHFNGVSTLQGPLQAQGHEVWADFHEINDYFRLTGRSGGYFRKTWFFDEEGKIEGYMISRVPGAPEPTKGRFEEFEAWAKENDPDELAYLLPGGRIDPTGDRPQRFRAILERWREATGEPLDLETD